MLLPSILCDLYWENGWLAVEGVFDNDQVYQIAEHVARLVAHRAPPPYDGLPHFEPDDALLAPFGHDPVIRKLLLGSRLPGIVAQIFDQTPLLVHDQLTYKPPHTDAPTALHRDNAFLNCRPEDGVLTAWIALDDVDEDNGCLRYIEGSHKTPAPKSTLPAIPESSDDHSAAPAARGVGTPSDEIPGFLPPPEPKAHAPREALARVRRGSVVFHHGNTLHGSLGNLTDRWHRAYTTFWVTPSVSCETDLLQRIAYFLRPQLWEGLNTDMLMHR